VVEETVFEDAELDETVLEDAELDETDCFKNPEM
jgi:hypothetical protein